MATQTLSAADAILKDLYVGPIVEQLNYKTYVLDQIERDSDHIDHTGRRAVIPVHKGRNLGRGSRGDGGTLPSAGRQAWLDAIVNIRYHYYGIEVTDGAVEATKSNEGAFVRLLEEESKRVAQDMRKDINRQVFGTGDGVLCNISGAEAMGQTVLSVDSVQFIQIGDTVDVLRRSDGVVAVQNSVVTARDNTAGANTITVSVALAAAADATYGVYLAGSRNQEMDGLRNIISSGRTLHSINSATAGNEFWNSQVISAAGNVAGESLYEQLADRVGATGQGEVEVFLTERGARRRLADTYQSQKRFNDAKAVQVHGGYTAIMVNEIPVVADDDVPKTSGAANGSTFAFGLNKGSFRWFEQTKPGWLESKDGQVFHLKPSSTAGQFDSIWQAWFRWYAALGCVAPNRNGVLTAVQGDNPV